jgi:hypothetical protein
MRITCRVQGHNAIYEIFSPGDLCDSAVILVMANASELLWQSMVMSSYVYWDIFGRSEPLSLMFEQTK